MREEWFALGARAQHPEIVGRNAVTQASPLPGPWCDPEFQDDMPWKARRGVIKFLEFPVRIPEMSHRAFHLYWQRHHSPHVMNTTGFSQFMRKYMTAHVYPERAAGLPAHYIQETPFEGAAEVWIGGLEEIGAWLSHPQHAELIQPDESRFIRQDGSVEAVIVREERIHRIDVDASETGLVKVFAIYERRDDLSQLAFHEQLSALARASTAVDALRSRLRALSVSHRIADPYVEGMPPTSIDAVAEFWFTNRTDMRAFFADPAFASTFGDAEARLLKRAAARAIVTLVHVVHDEFSFQPTLMQPQAFDWND